MARNFALIVGNSGFEDRSLAGLISPAADVRELAAVLQDPEIGGFTEVISLVNEPEARVRRGIASLFARRMPEDLLLLYVSTHGILDENGRLFLAARDTQRDLLKATAISAAFITDEMDNSSSRRQVLVLDCCHSGAFSRGAKGVPGSSVSTGAAFEGNGFGRVVLTATDSTQYAWDGDRVIGGSDVSSSVFTRHLVEGLRTGAADEDDDGQITLDELYEYVYRHVLSQSPRQTPGKWAYRQQGNLVIARNPNPGRKVSELPDHLRHALESEFTSTREAAVRDLARYLHGPQPGLARAAGKALERISLEDDSRRVQRLADAVLKENRKGRGEQGEKPAAPSSARPAEASQRPAASAPATSGGSIKADRSQRPVAGPGPPPEHRSRAQAHEKERAKGPLGQAAAVKPAQLKSILAEEKVALLVVLGALLTFGLFLFIFASLDKKEETVEEVPMSTELRSTEPMGTEPTSTEPMGTEPIGTEVMGTEPMGTEMPPEESPSGPSWASLSSYISQACRDCGNLATFYEGSLSTSGQVQRSFALRGGSNPVIAATCTPLPCDIDLFLVESEEIRDSSVSSAAALRFTPSTTGTFNVRIVMHRCGTSACSYTIGSWFDEEPSSRTASPG